MSVEITRKMNHFLSTFRLKIISDELPHQTFLSNRTESEPFTHANYEHLMALVKCHQLSLRDFYRMFIMVR